MLVVVGVALQAIPGIGTAIGLGMITAGISTAAVVGLALTIAGSLLMAPKAPHLGLDASSAQIMRLTATLVGTEPRKIAFGGTTALPNDVRYQVYTGTNQAYLDMIVCHGSHEVHSIDELWLDNEKAWTAAGGAQGRFVGYLTVTTRTLGTSSNGIAIDSTWTSSCTLTGCAYSHVQFKLTGASSSQTSPFSSGVTSRTTWRGKGAKVYDPRLDSTVAGGSGSQRATDQTTWAWDDNASRNPALQELFYELGWKINGKLAVGKGVPPARIDLASYAVAANACDESITLNGGGTEPRYRADCVISEGDDTSTVRNGFCAAMNAVLRDSGGKLSIWVSHNDLATPVTPSSKLSFDQYDIEGDMQWEQTPDLNSTFNIVRGRRIDPSDTALYQPTDFPEVSLTSPDGIDRIDTVDYAIVQSNGQAQRLAKQRLERGQYQGKLTFTGLPSFWGLSLGDVFPLSHPAFGWSGKLFRVVSQKISRTGATDIVAVEENTAIYAWGNNESAPVTPGTPTVYDPLNDALVVGISAAGTAAATASAAASAAAAAAAAAQADATTAVGELSDMANDGRLTPVEKRTAANDYNKLLADQGDIDAKATLYSIATEKTNYDNAISALTTYLATLTSPVLWTDRSNYTTIVGSTWNTKWDAVYSTRQLLLNKIAAVAKSLADAASSAAASAAAAAAAAQADATAALTEISAIGADGVLTPVEKQQIIVDWTRLQNEKSGIDAQATSYGVTTEKTAYDTAYSTLSSYLGGLSPAYNDTTASTAITRATWDSNWTGVYSARQTLLNKIAQIAGVSAAPGDGNRVRFSQFERDTAGWGILDNPSSLVASLVAPTDATTGKKYIGTSFSATAAGQVLSIGSLGSSQSDYRVPVTGSERIFVGAKLGVACPGGSTWNLAVGFVDATGAVVSEPSAATGSGGLAFPDYHGGFISVPATAVGAWIEMYLTAGAAGSCIIELTEPIICGAGSAQTVFPAFSPGPSGELGAQVTRWIANPTQSLSFRYDYTLAAQSGEFPRDILFNLMTSAGAYSSGVTWSYTVLTGTVNGFTNASGAQSMSGSGTGTLTVSNLGSSTAKVQISATYLGQPYTLTVSLAEDVAAPPATTPAGGSGSTGTIASTSSFSSINSTTFTDVTGALVGTPAATSVHVNVDIDAMPISGLSGNWTVEMKVMRDISGTPTQIGSTQSASSDWDHIDATGDPASFSFAIADTGLTSGTTYTWRVYARLTTGTRTHYLTGTVTVTTP